MSGTRQELGRQKSRLYGSWIDLSEEAGKCNTVHCLANLPDCQNPLGRLLKIKIPGLHPKLTESESSGEGPENP